MARLATATDFFGGRMYDSYQKFPIFAERADIIMQRYPGAVGQKVVVVGCGPGAYLVEELVARGVNCFGLDAFGKNIAHGFVTIQPTPAIAARCVLDADMGINSDVNRLRQMAGLTGQQRFYLCISEDVLPCLTDQEIAAGVSVVNNRADRVFHIITCNQDPDSPDPGRDLTLGLQWLTREQWRARINAAGGSAHVCWDSEMRVEF